MTLDPKALEAAMDEAGSGWGMHLSADNKRRLMTAAISAYLAALSKEVQASEAVIKPLVWRDHSFKESVLHTAEMPYGQYSITYDADCEYPFVVRPFVTKQSNYETLEEAKADCEASHIERMQPFLATSQPLPATNRGALEAQAGELPRAANALLNNLWVGITSGARSHEENWIEFERLYPGVKWLHDALAALSVPAPGTVDAFLHANPLREDAPRYGDLADEIGTKIEALLSEERKGAFIGSHQVRAIKEIEAQIRAVPAPGTKEAVRVVAEVLMSHPLVDAPKDMAEHFTALAEAVVNALSPSTPVGEGKQP